MLHLEGCLKQPSTHIPKWLSTTSSSTQLFFRSCSQTKGLAKGAPAFYFAGPPGPKSEQEFEEGRRDADYAVIMSP